MVQGSQNHRGRKYHLDQDQFSANVQESKLKYFCEMVARLSLEHPQ